MIEGERVGTPGREFIRRFLLGFWGRGERITRKKKGSARTGVD